MIYYYVSHLSVCLSLTLSVCLLLSLSISISLFLSPSYVSFYLILFVSTSFSFSLVVFTLLCVPPFHSRPTIRMPAVTHAFMQSRLSWMQGPWGLNWPVKITANTLKLPRYASTCSTPSRKYFVKVLTRDQVSAGCKATRPIPMPKSPLLCSS